MEFNKVLTSCADCSKSFVAKSSYEERNKPRLCADCGGVEERVGSRSNFGFVVSYKEDLVETEMTDVDFLALIDIALMTRDYDWAKSLKLDFDEFLLYKSLPPELW
jgi:hypothetical protein